MLPKTKKVKQDCSQDLYFTEQNINIYRMLPKRNKAIWKISFLNWQTKPLLKLFYFIFSINIYPLYALFHPPPLLTPPQSPHFCQYHWR